MAREELSGEVTFEASEGKKSYTDLGGGGVIGRRRSENPEAGPALLNLGKSKEARGAEVQGVVRIEQSTTRGLVTQGKMKTSESLLYAKKALEGCEPGKDRLRLYFKRIIAVQRLSQGSTPWHLPLGWYQLKI